MRIPVVTGRTSRTSEVTLEFFNPGKSSRRGGSIAVESLSDLLLRQIKQTLADEEIKGTVSRYTLEITPGSGRILAKVYLT